MNKKGLTDLFAKSRFESICKRKCSCKTFLFCFFSKTKNINLISGQVGITLNVDWYEPTIFNETSHVEASETKLQFFAGWFANPIFVNGKYPEVMRQKVNRYK